MYEIFEQLLKEKGLTAYKVSQQTGVSTATITSWKKGIYKPKPEKLQKIADFLGVQLEYLMGASQFRTKEEMFSKWDNSNKDLLFNNQPTPHDEKVTQLLNNYDLLNETGKKKLLENSKDLTEIPKYTDK